MARQSSPISPFYETGLNINNPEKETKMKEIIVGTINNDLDVIVRPRSTGVLTKWDAIVTDPYQEQIIVENVSFRYAYSQARRYLDEHGGELKIFD